MKTGITTAAVLLGFAAVSVLGWAASRTPAPPVRRAIVIQTTVPGPAPCTTGQLGLVYYGGQASGGSNFGNIVAWDRSAADCSLTSPILVTGLDKAGRPVTGTLLYLVRAPDQLSGNGTKPAAGLQLSAGETAAPLIVSAAYRNGSQGRPCAHPIEPVTWRLTLASGGRLTIPNADPRDAAEHSRTLPANHGLLTCSGQLSHPLPVAITP